MIGSKVARDAPASVVYDGYPARPRAGRDMDMRSSTETAEQFDRRFDTIVTLHAE